MTGGVTLGAACSPNDSTSTRLARGGSDASAAAGDSGGMQAGQGHGGAGGDASVEVGASDGPGCGSGDAGGIVVSDASGSDAAGEAEALDPCGPSNPAVVPLPVIPAAIFQASAFGAVGDGKTDDTKALQAALDAATSAGGGTVVVGAGTFLSGPITMGSGTRLELAAGALLEMLPMGTWPGTTPLVTANNAHDIALTGAGTIDGQGQPWWNALTANPDLVRPQEVVFTNSSRVLVTGIRLQNPPEEHIWVKGDTDVTVTGITIETLAVAGQHAPNNTDGVDIDATGVFFCGNSVADGDDNVVMEGKQIYVGYSTFGAGHGCSIGSITSAGVSAVTVDHLTMNGTESGIRMKSARGRGGLVHDLTYSNITMTNVGVPVSITSYYPDLPADPTADPGQAVDATTPEWQDITITNLQATGATTAGILWGLPEARIANVTLDDVRVEGSAGMEIFHATGISFVAGSTIAAAKRPAVTTYDAVVTGVTTQAYP